MGIFPGDFGAPTTSVTALDADDVGAWSVDGAIAPVTLGAMRGISYVTANTGAAYTATRTGLSEDFFLTVTGNATITLAGGGVTGEVSVWNIVFKQDGTGGRSITVSGVEWVGGTPTFTTTAGASNHCSFKQYGSGPIYGLFGGAAAS